MSAPDVNSYSILIRDGLLARVQALPFFATVAKFGHSKAKIIQAEHIPYFGCYLIEENLSPDGDANAAEPRFLHRLNLGFSYIIQNIDPDEAEDTLDAGHWAVMNLLTQPDWHTFRDGNAVVLAQIEAVTGGHRSHEFGSIGSSQNETPIAEMRMELTYTFRTGFPPVIPDILEHVHVETVYPWPKDPNRQSVISEIDIDTTPEP